MEFSKKTIKDHQFLEVDEDLRRIGEMESSNPLCPFGKNCYRKNPSHLREYRHHSGSAKHSPTSDKIDPKRGKITDYFNQKPFGVKKLSIESSVHPNGDQRYDNPKNKVETESASNEDKANTSEQNNKRIKFEAGSSSDQKKKSKTNDIWITSDFDDICKTNDNNLKPFSKRNSSPKASTLKPIEDKTCDKDLKQIKSIENSETTNQSLNESKEEKTSIIDLMKPKSTPNELNQLIKDIFLFEMPKDFFILWQFCKTINREKPEDAFVETLGLRLVGPYDILTGKVKTSQIKDREQILCHWRYFYDLPEFQTIIASVKSGYHLGYFRDTSDEDNPVVVSNNSDKSCVIEGVADNICAAIYTEIQKLKSKDSSNSSLKHLETKLKAFCSQSKIDLNSNSKLKSRKSKINAKTFNGFGFVVPYDKKTEVGYRPLPETDSNLKRLLNAILKVDSEARSECKSLIELQEIIQLITYANDECDFGMGLELGIDLFCFGDQFFHKSSLHLLTMAYDLLKREPFGRIITAHLQNRRKGFKLDSI